MNATDTRTYRGRTLEEVLPKIKAELGPDAEIVRQRSGLTGGVGGFFQRECVEVEARGPERAGRRFDAYDDAPAVPEPYTPEPEPEPESFVPDLPQAEGLSAPGIQEILRQAAPFADALESASRELEPATPEPTPPATRDLGPATPARDRPPTADSYEAQLKDAGLDGDLSRELLAEVVSHELPFASPRSLKRLARRAPAPPLPAALAAPAGAPPRAPPDRRGRPGGRPLGGLRRPRRLGQDAVRRPPGRRLRDRLGPARRGG